MRKNHGKADGRIMKRWKKKKVFLKDGKAKDAATVIFVPSTKGSAFIKSLKEDEDKMAEITGFRVKYQEAGGDILTNFFSKNLASGKHCGRPECPPCMKQDGRVNCKARNIVYESKCLVCNPQTSRQEDEDEDNQPSGTIDSPREGIYIGEQKKSTTQRLGLMGPGEGGDIPLNILRLDQHPEIRNLLGGGHNEASHTGESSPGVMEGVGVETNADNTIYERSQPNSYQHVIHEQHQGHGTDKTLQ